MFVLGCNSGTSVDAIDIAVCEINDHIVNNNSTTFIGMDNNNDLLTLPSQNNLSVKLIAFESISWEKSLKERIFKLMYEPVFAKEYCEVNVLIGKAFANAIEFTLNKHSIDKSTVKVIGFHGQTIYHQVESNNLENKGFVRSTLQIGEACEIATKLGINVVSNFRASDVALGGQGAPLVHILDFLLLRHETDWRAIQNIGGIGNVTFVPPLSIIDNPSSLVTSFDTGCGNSMIDDVVRILTNNELQMDIDGKMGFSGKLNNELFKDLCDYYEHYFSMPYPKTTGRELFGKKQVEYWLNYCKEKYPHLDNNSIVTTFTELTVESIIRSYLMVCKNNPSITQFQVIVAGGGKNNPYLMSRLSQRLKECFKKEITIKTHEEIMNNNLASEAKEGILFALLAYLNEKQIPGNLPSVTGASKPTILGVRCQITQ
ncbi:hypothetical protein ABK040_016794 [Willaertia magna]